MYLRGTVIGPRLGMFWVIALWWAVIYARVIDPRLAILHNIGVMDGTVFSPQSSCNYAYVSVVVCQNSL